MIHAIELLTIELLTREAMLMRKDGLPILAEEYERAAEILREIINDRSGHPEHGGREKEMITLKTLPAATAQEVYNQVKEHLLKQAGPVAETGQNQETP